MKKLKNKLDSIEGIQERTVKALISELLPLLIQAQNDGYTVQAIYEVFNEKRKVSINTFKGTFYRLKQKNKPI